MPSRSHTQRALAPGPTQKSDHIDHVDGASRVDADINIETDEGSSSAGRVSSATESAHDMLNRTVTVSTTRTVPCPTEQSTSSLHADDDVGERECQPDGFETRGCTPDGGDASGAMQVLGRLHEALDYAVLVAKGEPDTMEVGMLVGQLHSMKAEGEDTLVDLARRRDWTALLDATTALMAGSPSKTHGFTVL